MAAPGAIVASMRAQGFDLEVPDPRGPPRRRGRSRRRRRRRCRCVSAARARRRVVVPALDARGEHALDATRAAASASSASRSTTMTSAPASRNACAIPAPIGRRRARRRGRARVMLLRHCLLPSRKAVMRRSFSGLSNSSACASRSTAGCASRGAREDPLRELGGPRVVGGDPVGDRVGGIEQLVGGVERRHQAGSERLVRIEHPAGQQQLDREGVADDLLEPPGRAGGGDDAEARSRGCRCGRRARRCGCRPRRRARRRRRGRNRRSRR